MKFILALAILAFSGVAFSQTNFVPGYIITHQSDTSRGFIDYRSSATSFGFRNSKNAESKTYGISDINGFGITNSKVFQVKKIPIDSIRSDVFAEVLTRGRANLYRYGNSFFIEKDTTIRALTQSTRTVAGQYHHVSKQYVGILNLLFRDCAEMSKDVMAVRLNERSLTNITTRYNQCKGESYKDVKSGIPWFRADLSVFAGYDVTSFSFRTGSQRIQDPEPKVMGSAPTIGVGAVFSNPRELERLSATIDLQFSQMTFDESAQTYAGQNRYDEEYSLKFTRLRIPLGVKYILKPGTAVSYYARVGYAFNMWRNGDIKVSQVFHRPGVPTYTENFNYDLSNYSVGQFWFSVGTQINKFKVKGFLELRVEAIGGNSNPALVNQYGNPVIEPKSISVQTYSLNLGITF